MTSGEIAEKGIFTILDIREARRFQAAASDLAGLPVTICGPDGQTADGLAEERAVYLYRHILSGGLGGIPGRLREEEGFLLSPVIVGEDILGLIICGPLEEESRPFSDEQRRLVPFFSQMVAMMLQSVSRKDDEEHLKWRIRELSSLLGIIKSLNSGTGMKESARNFLQRVIAFADASSGAVMYLDTDRRLITCLAEYGCSPVLQDVQLALGEDLSGMVIETAEHHYIPDMNLSDLPARQDFRAGFGLNVISLLSVPMMIDNRCVGVVHIGYQHKHEPTVEMLDFLYMVAGEAAVFIEHSRLFDQVSQLAVTDGLTRLNNHRYLQQRLDGEIERARRFQRPLSLLMIDIDHFKRYNDRFGHPAGDLLLKRLSRLFSKSVRSIDILARYGGEEFCIVLPETGAAEAEATAERIRAQVRENLHYYNQEDGSEGMVTVSIGVATSPVDGVGKTALLEAADKALYRAKAGGRDRVVLASKRHRDVAEGLAAAFSVRGGDKSPAASSMPSPQGWRFPAAVIIIAVTFLAQYFFRQHYGGIFPRVFLYLHGLMEFYSVAVGFIIYFIAFDAAKRSGNSRLATFGRAFIVMAILDALHFLSFPGGPDWFADPESSISIWLWLFSRLTGVAMIIVATFGPRRRSQGIVAENAWHEALWPVLLALLIYLGTDRYLSLRPIPFDPVSGAGPMSLLLEAFVSVLYIAAAAGFFKQYLQRGSILLLMFSVGMACMAFAGSNVLLQGGAHGILPHVYKCLAYLAILAGLWLVEIEDVPATMPRESTGSAAQDLPVVSFRSDL